MMEHAGDLRDGFGRVARRLRLSVTDRCNLRCVYCMPENPRWMPRDSVLSFEEFLRLARAAVGLGVRRVRVTGGEPLVRKDLHVLVRGLADLVGPGAVGLTTNGYFLARQARSLSEAGLRTVNVSLDTLVPATFRRMARRDGLRQTLEGIQAAEDSGLRIKLNMVVMAGVNEGEVPAFGRLARERGWEVRFIEYMPLDGDHAWERGKVYPAARIREDLGRVGPLVPLGSDPSDPASLWGFADGVGKVGFIASVTEPFCEHCDRVRITADGKLRNCLFSTAETDLRGPLRSGASDEELAAIMLDAVALKGPGHAIGLAGFRQPARAMNAIGG
ncbi:MAG: GTP 3',8-cyclase MoaA [Planctomycetes bacterium]|nr:GTP 3',8-cyclase MoaA [Planctomycetota bacterium]